MAAFGGMLNNRFPVNVNTAMRSEYIILPLLAVLLFAVTGRSFSQQKNTVEQVISNTAHHFAPDRRVALFDVEIQTVGGRMVLTGETNLPDAKTALLDSLSRLQVKADDNIRVLPATELEGRAFGVVNNSVANIRSRPSHHAQLATQATLGMPLNVLKKESGWYLVQTPDDYISWIDSGGLQLMDKNRFEEWKSSSKLIYLNTYGHAYQGPSTASGNISDLVSGSILKLAGIEGNYYKVSYPDGRTGFVARSEARPFDDWKASVGASEENLVETAKTMLGAPYLWGGTSAKGMDCSGFTKTVYFMNGWIIPRDASQQVYAGEPVDTSEGFENLRPGDLLFFGRPATGSSSQRVVHVGIWIGNNEFIHSSGRVRISSFDPEADNFDEFNLNRFLEGRRYLQHIRGNIMDVAHMYSLNE